MDLYKRICTAAAEFNLCASRKCFPFFGCDARLSSIIDIQLQNGGFQKLLFGGERVGCDISHDKLCDN